MRLSIINKVMIVNTIDGNEVFGPCENQQVDHHELSMLLFLHHAASLRHGVLLSAVSDIKVVFKVACANIRSHCSLLLVVLLHIDSFAEVGLV